MLVILWLVVGIAGLLAYAVIVGRGSRSVAPPRRQLIVECACLTVALFAAGAVVDELAGKPPMTWGLATYRLVSSALVSWFLQFTFRRIQQRR